MICLVRHGTTPTTGKVLPGRAKGLHLSETGLGEARRAADLLSGVPVAAVYSSPLERARETAAPIARALGARVRVDRRLVECDFGEWTGAELAKLRKLPEWTTVQHWPSGWRFPKGESFVEVQGRMTAVIDAYRHAHPGEVVVAVSHADCIKALLASCLGLPLDLFQRINVGPASTSAVALGADGPSVLAMNCYGSLPGLFPHAPGADKAAKAVSANGPGGPRRPSSKVNPRRPSSKVKSG
ncbi:MAG: MSMEG_4193 family putative phosphomutase [Acidimicrobiales bacterium]